MIPLNTDSQMFLFQWKKLITKNSNSLRHRWYVNKLMSHPNGVFIFCRFGSRMPVQNSGETVYIRRAWEWTIFRTIPPSRPHQCLHPNCPIDLWALPAPPAPLRHSTVTTQTPPCLLSSSTTLKHSFDCYITWRSFINWRKENHTVKERPHPALSFVVMPFQFASEWNSEYLHSMYCILHIMMSATF